MNQPPFIVVYEIRSIIEAMRVSLAAWLVDRGFTTINYEFGPVTELSARLLAKDKTVENRVLKFPLIWVEQPFGLSHDRWGKFATTQGLNIFIIHETKKQYTSGERMENIFIPVLYPLYAELIRLLNISGSRLQTFQNPVHIQTDFYYWGEAQQQVLNDIVDCMKIENIKLQVNNNSNCPEDFEIE